jgi:hypothetical protein
MRQRTNITPTPKPFEESRKLFCLRQKKNVLIARDYDCQLLCPYDNSCILKES